MTHDPLVERLAGELRPVRRRNPRRDAVLVAALALFEVVLLVAIGLMRPDMPRAMAQMAFWWKLASLGAIAAIGTPTALLSLDPTRSARHGLRALLVVLLVVVASGWAIDAIGAPGASLLTRLDWRQGVQCLWKMVALSMPPVLALGLLMRRGASTDPAASALAAGIAAAAWGGLVFIAACPSDDPFYVAVWYALAIAIVTLAARVTLPALTRW